jgi:hypothetical protein
LHRELAGTVKEERPVDASKQTPGAGLKNPPTIQDGPQNQIESKPRFSVLGHPKRIPAAIAASLSFSHTNASLPPEGAALTLHRGSRLPSAVEVEPNASLPVRKHRKESRKK